MDPTVDPAALDLAAEIVAGAGALLVTAGAGMGVDSGLPDFRGPEGFWRAYPAYRGLGLHFMDLANPTHFRRDPTLAWGFYGHRLGLYRATRPHEGFHLLRDWGTRLPGGCAVFTSNVDGQFQRAGFDEGLIEEVHGSIHHLQCVERCGSEVFPADGIDVDVDPAAMRARPPLPACPACGGLARPNILMFGDGAWDHVRSAAQGRRVADWLRQRSAAGQRLAIVELGAGTAIPTVRMYSEEAAVWPGGRIVRINVRDPEVPPGEHVGLACGALAGLRGIATRLDW